MINQSTGGQPISTNAHVLSPRVAWKCRTEKNDGPKESRKQKMQDWKNRT